MSPRAESMVAALRSGARYVAGRVLLSAVFVTAECLIGIERLTRAAFATIGARRLA